MNIVIGRTTCAYDVAHNRMQKVHSGVAANNGYNSLNHMTGFDARIAQVSHA